MANQKNLFFILIEVLIPFVIHGFASCLISPLDAIFKGACFRTTLINCLQKV